MGGTRVGSAAARGGPGRDPFGAADRRLLEDVGSQVGALVQAVSINRDLQLSRQHLITAREEERRRVRRDLHDGLGPSLATLAMRLDAARDLIAEDPERAADCRTSSPTRPVRRSPRCAGSSTACGHRPWTSSGWCRPCGSEPTSTTWRSRSHRGRTGMTWSVGGRRRARAAARGGGGGGVPDRGRGGEQRRPAQRGRDLHGDPAAATPKRCTSRSATPGSAWPRAAAPGVGLSSMRERAEELGGTCTVTSAAGTRHAGRGDTAAGVSARHEIREWSDGAVARPRGRRPREVPKGLEAMLAADRVPSRWSAAWPTVARRSTSPSSCSPT